MLSACGLIWAVVRLVGWLQNEGPAGRFRFGRIVGSRNDSNAAGATSKLFLNLFLASQSGCRRTAATPESPIMSL